MWTLTLESTNDFSRVARLILARIGLTEERLEQMDATVYGFDVSLAWMIYQSADYTQNQLSMYGRITQTTGLVTVDDIVSYSFPFQFLESSIRPFGMGSDDDMYLRHVLCFEKIGRVMLRVKMPTATFFQGHELRWQVLKLQTLIPNMICYSCDKIVETWVPLPGSELRRLQNSPAAIKTCSGCRTARYCCIECQDVDWAVHKKYCHRLSAEKPLRWLVDDDEKMRMEGAATEWYEEVGRGLGWTTPIQKYVMRAHNVAAALMAKGFDATCVHRHRRELTAHVLSLM